jgi:hypothetical protein
MSPRATQKKSSAWSQTKRKSKHPIRIVPLHPPAAAAALPHLTYRGGPLLTNVEVFAIFWGAGWNDATNALLVQEMNSFFEFILTSALMDQLAEYSVPGKTIEHGSLHGTKTITTSSPGKSVTDAAIQQFLQTEISGGSLPEPSTNLLYFVFLQPGTQVKQGTAASCKDFCGNHDATPTGDIFYAVMPFPGCSGCLGGLETLPALTSTTSHELCEAITDPIPGQGWYDDANGEIGDICAWKTKQVGSYTVQLEWSNGGNRCE